MKHIIVLCILLASVLSGCATSSDGKGFLVYTADPNLAIQIPFAETTEVVPEVKPDPPCILVKGNISRAGEKIYHVPGGPNYSQVKIEEEAGERFFCSEEEAEAAGWRKVNR